MLLDNLHTTELGRKHNNANILCLRKDSTKRFYNAIGENFGTNLMETPDLSEEKKIKELGKSMIP